MLIYARKEQCSGTFRVSDGALQVTTDNQPAGNILPAPPPPNHALHVVKELNAAHDEACEMFSEKQVKHHLLGLSAYRLLTDREMP
jgi:hypothetical protein